MSKRLKREMNRIDIPEELRERSRRGVMKAGKEKPVRRRKPYGWIAAVAALVLLLGGGIVTLISVQDERNVSSPQSSSESAGDSSAGEEAETTEESGAMPGLLYIEGDVYINRGPKEVQPGKEIGEVRRLIPREETPSGHLTSNVLPAGTVIYETEEEGVLAAEREDGTLLRFVREERSP